MDNGGRREQERGGEWIDGWTEEDEGGERERESAAVGG